MTGKNKWVWNDDDDDDDEEECNKDVDDANHNNYNTTHFMAIICFYK